MRLVRLAIRSLAWYWRTNAAVVLGVALTTAVLCGALAVGDSVRSSLRKLAVERLGATQSVLASKGFFREALADSFTPSAPLLSLEAFAVHVDSKRSAGNVAVYGVDERFYRFHGVPPEKLTGGQVLLSPELANELTAKAGDPVLLRFEAPSSIPREFLQGRKEETGKTVRLTVAEGISPKSLAEFALRAQQGYVRAAFVPLRRLQRDLDRAGQVNTVLLGDVPNAEFRLREKYDLPDAGLSLRRLDGRTYALEHSSTLLDDATAKVALESGKSLGLKTSQVLTYLASAIRAHGLETPYSLVTATDVESRGVVANEWLARDLKLRAGDELELEYLVWSDDNRLRTESAKVRLDSITPMSGWALDRDVAPPYPGITDIDSIAGWDPPFPLDLKRVRPKDEEYWKKYRTTPKLWIPLAIGQRLWGTRYGKVTSIRFTPGDGRLPQVLHGSIDPLASQFVLQPVRSQHLDAARGSTDFGEYFLYFSFFVIVSAMLLTSLFFRLGVEQRAREIGTLKALGFKDGDVRTAFLWEGLALSVLGVLLGLVLAAGYAGLLVYGLRTWWVDAVGTRLLELRLTPKSLGAGAIGAFITALLSTLWGLRALRDATPRGLMSGWTREGGASWRKPASVVSGIGALLMAGLGAAKVIAAEAGFFGAGLLLLTSLLLAASVLLRGVPVALIPIPGAGALARLGVRNAGWRPGRSVLSIALIAMATFLIVSLEAFRRDGSAAVGRYALMGESQAPLIYDPNTADGRDSLNLTQTPEAKWEMFRVRPGDDVSCLNLYAPVNPRVLGARSSYLKEDQLELVDQAPVDGAVPAAVDANSLTYVLHKSVGDEVRIDRQGATPLRLRVVAAPKDSVFQSEIVISERNFTRLFPEIAGYRVFLIAAPMEAAAAFEDALSDYGFDATPTASRLASYHRVENTYLSTFQALGALGVLLGTIGLAAVLLRNALERRRELGLLRALGFGDGGVGWVVLSENLVMLGGGLLIGVVSALVAVTPAVRARGTGLPLLALVAVTFLILVTGAVASFVAARLVVKEPLLAALRSE